METRGECSCFNRDSNEKGTEMINEVTMKQLTEAEDMAYFCADLCPYSPEACTLDEKRQICEGMVSASKALLDEMRRNFEQYTTEQKAILLNALCQSGVENLQWWWDVSVAEGTQYEQVTRL